MISILFFLGTCAAGGVTAAGGFYAADWQQGVPQPEPADTSETETEPGDEMPQGVAEPDTTALQPPAEESFIEVALWPEAPMAGTRIAETDSTLRWAMALNWADRLSRRPGAFTYRTGRLGQTDGLDIHAYENRHQRLRFNELEATDPVTGQINWNRLPIHKISTIRTDENAWNFTTDVTLREHYMVQPRTYLNFDEGVGDYRNLEFSFTHNFGEQLNVELSFWDRSDGDNFARNSMDGHQITFRTRYHMTDRLLIQAGYINNAINLEQPFGYQILDPASYNFNPFITPPTEPNASSSQGANDLYLQIYHRREADEPARRAAGIQYQTDSRELTYSQDTTAYALNDIGLFAWQELRAGEARLRARAAGHLLSERGGGSLQMNSHLLADATLRGELPLPAGLTLNTGGAYRIRDDGRSDQDLSAALLFRPFDPLELEASAAAGSSMPTLQALYWESAEFSGDESLGNESGLQSALSARLTFLRYLKLGLRGGTRQTDQGIFVDPNGQFVNIDSYTTLFGSAWLELDSPRFEGALSATLRQATSSSLHPVNRLLDESGEQMMFKGSLYWKNYLFNRATFVKAGVSGFITPGGYVPAGYHVPLNRWQHGIAMERLGDFHRMDVEVSARVRWFMVLLRYENVLDGMNQLGYFETGRYPMPGRRFIAAFRVVFTN